jgi:hypothetical protein
MGRESEDWIQLAEHWTKWRALMNRATHFQVPWMRGIPWLADPLSDIQEELRSRNLDNYA